MNENELNPQPQLEPQLVERPGESLSRYTAQAFLWMALGLLVTFGISVAGYITWLPLYILSINDYAIHFIALAELIVVIVLSAKLHAMPVGAARALFLVYAILNGVVFSTYFFLFDVMSIVLAFGAAGLYFGVMAVVGYVTKVDFSRIRNLLFGGLIFLVVFSLLSMFIPGLAMFDRVVCMIGIVVFMLYTAYDTQKIKAFYYGFQGDDVMLGLRPPSFPPWSCTWTSSTCSSISCAFWGNGRTEKRTSNPSVTSFDIKKRTPPGVRFFMFCFLTPTPRLLPLK